MTTFIYIVFFGIVNFMGYKIMAFKKPVTKLVSGIGFVCLMILLLKLYPYLYIDGEMIKPKAISILLILSMALPLIGFVLSKNTAVLREADKHPKLKWITGLDYNANIALCIFFAQIMMLLTNKDFEV